MSLPYAGHQEPPQAGKEKNHLGCVTSSPRHIKAITSNAQCISQTSARGILDIDSNDRGIQRYYFRTGRIQLSNRYCISKNRGTPKSSTLIGFSLINYKPSILGYPYFWFNTQIKYLMDFDGIHLMNPPCFWGQIWIWTFWILRNEIQIQCNHKNTTWHIITIDGWNPANQLRLVVSAPSKRWFFPWDFSHQISHSTRCLNHSHQPHEANNTQDVGSTRGAYLQSTSWGWRGFWLDRFESFWP